MNPTRTVTLPILLIILLGIGAFFTQPAAASIETFPVGRGPIGLAFDGNSIWVADFEGYAMTKLRASDGKVLGTFPVVKGPAYAAFDGANIWVTNFYDATVAKLRASDGALLGTFPVGTNPIGILFDGDNI